MDALEKVHQTICKLYLQAPEAYRNETHKIEYLRHAVIGMTWAKEPLSRLASLNLSYQEFYSQLEASIQQERDEKKYLAVDKANAHITGQEATSSEELKQAIPGVLFASQARYGRNPKDNRNGVRTCFKCGSDKHLLRQCPQRKDFIETAAQKVQTYNKFRPNVNNSKRVLYEICEQLEECPQSEEDESFTPAEVFFGDIEFEETIREDSTTQPDEDIPIIVEGLFNSASDQQRPRY